MGHLLVALQQQPDPLRCDTRNAMNCRRCGGFTTCQSDPSRAVPVLKMMVPNAALRVVIPSAYRLHQRDNVEALLLSQIHFQPARGLPLIQVPTRSGVT